MSQAQTFLYPITRDTHATALFNASGRMSAMAEDVGCHNGLDKVVGGGLAGRGDLSTTTALALSS